MLQERTRHVCLLLVVLAASSPVVTVEPICGSEELSISCPARHVIVVNRADYGRMRLGRCVTGFKGNLCRNNVRSTLDAACSGRRKCQLRVDDKTFPSAKPCHPDLKSYLDVDYECLEVAVGGPPPRTCRGRGENVLTASAGVIASLVTDETSCGSPESPWVVNAAAGQTVNVTLVDFMTGHYHDGREGALATAATAQCRVYATIRSTNDDHSTTVCGSVQRQRLVFVARDSGVQIRVLNKKDDHKKDYFLLHYSVSGCPEPEVPPYSSLRRHADEAFFTCTQDGATWTLTCKNGSWGGAPASHCSAPTLSERIADTFSLPHGLSIAIIIAIAFVVGVFILVFGLLCFKWKHVPRAGAIEEQTSCPAHAHSHAQLAQLAQLHGRRPTAAHAYDDAKTFSGKPSAGQFCVAPRAMPPDHIYESPETIRRMLQPSLDGKHQQQHQQHQQQHQHFQCEAAELCPMAVGSMDGVF